MPSAGGEHRARAVVVLDGRQAEPQPAVADEVGLSMAQLAVAWVLQNDNVAAALESLLTSKWGGSLLSLNKGLDTPGGYSTSEQGGAR